MQNEARRRRRVRPIGQRCDGFIWTRVTEIAPIAVKAYVFGSTRLMMNTGKRFAEGPSMVTGSAENSAAMLAGQIARRTTGPRRPGGDTARQPSRCRPPEI